MAFEPDRRDAASLTYYFDALCSGDQRPSMLVDGHTVIEANRSALRDLDLNLIGKSIDDVFVDAGPDLETYIQYCASVRRAVPGTFAVRGIAGDIVTWHTEGFQVSPALGGREALVLLRFYPENLEHIGSQRLTRANLELAAEIIRAGQLAEQLAKTLNDYRGVFENAAVGIAIVSLDGRWINVNNRVCEIVGYARDVLLTKTFQDITHPDDLAPDLELVAQLIRNDVQSYALDKRYMRAGGGVTWVRLTVSLLRDNAGQPIQFVSVIEDINDLKRVEWQRNLIIGELNHRVKNKLAIVQGIVQQTIATFPDPKTFGEVLQKRLQSLSRAYDLLNETDWVEPDIWKVVERAVLIPFVGFANRITFTGAKAQLEPEAAITLGLTLYELATNAVKYGALSNDHGNVAIHGERVSRDAGDRYILSWVERAGPTPALPEREGFGSFMLKRAVEFTLNGESTVSFGTAGFECTIAFPLEDTRNR